MPSTIVLKRRITSIRSTRQITKAMQLVSASKLRRAQAEAQKSRPYQELAYSMLNRLGGMAEVKSSPMFAAREIHSRLYVVITSNSGLAGAYNANINKRLLERIRHDDKQQIKASVISVGTKGAQFVRHLSGVSLTAVFQPFGDSPTADSIRPLLNQCLEMYEAGSVDSIELIYTSYKSTISQQVTNLPLLPVTPPELPADDAALPVATFEPDVETVIAEVSVRLIEAQLWQAVLDSLASEHAMRMVATKNATDNANDLIQDYTLALNTARQAAITQELAEITGGAEALNG